MTENVPLNPEKPERDLVSLLRQGIVEDLQFLEQWVFERLARMSKYDNLGSATDKTRRLVGLVGRPSLYDPTGFKGHAAALLCKVDLTSNMVREFPEMQGAMGEIYAAQNPFIQQLELKINILEMLIKKDMIDRNLP